MDSSSGASNRILSLLDENSFVETGAGVRARATDFNQEPKQAKSDGVITGYGTIFGKPVCVYSQDSAVLGGSIGEMHAEKIVRLYDLAIRTGAPIIGLIDSTGVRIRESVDALNALGKIYAQQAKASGIIPQITAVMGTCGGGLALIPSLSDFTFASEKASLFVNSPNAIEGNREDKNNTSSASFKLASGDADAVLTEEEIFTEIRNLIEILPSNYEEEAVADCEDELNRAATDFEALAADGAAAAAVIADNGVFVETGRGYAPEMTTGFVRLNGITCGIVSNTSAKYDEEGEVSAKFDKVLTAAGAEKAAAFVKFCDAFGLPVITFTDVEGFAASEAEEKAFGRNGGTLVNTFAAATSPKINVIKGAAIGSAGIVMNSQAIGADITYALPGAQIGAMKGGLASFILENGKSAGEIAKTASELDALQNSVESAAARGYVDRIVNPEDLRVYLISAVEMLYTKRTETLSRRHSAR